MFYQFNHFGIREHFVKEYGENFRFPVHLHNSFEFITVTAGEMTVTVDDHTYLLQAGESVFIFPNQMHSLYSKNSRHMLCIFSPELVRAYAVTVSDKIPAENSVICGRPLLEALETLSPNASIMEKKSVLYALCALFDKTAALRDRHRVSDGILYRIFAFVEQNFGGDCSLARLAGETGYSYAYLSRCFRKATGIPFHSYVNQYRISNACYLLRNTSHSILQCALDSGYDSLRSFNRNFREALGMTPGEYRNGGGQTQGYHP